MIVCRQSFLLYSLQNAEILALEEKVFGIWCDRTERLVTRRHQDVLDLMEECSRIDGRDDDRRRGDRHGELPCRRKAFEC